MKALKRSVRRLLDAIHRRRRVVELAATEQHVTPERLTTDLRALGIAAGDCVWVHSSLKSLGYVEGGAAAVLEAIWQAVQPGGTLVVPTYYMKGTILETCSDPDYVFDPQKLGSNLGALPDQFLKRPGVRRSIHPTHSVSALGPKADYIVEAHHLGGTTFDENSPWGRFTKINGKVLGLGISMGPVTYYHHLEDMLGDSYPIDVWMPESYALRCIDHEGRPLTVSVRPFKPELMQIRIDHPSQDELRRQMWDELERRRLLHTGSVGLATGWWISSQEFLTALRELAAQGKTVYGAWNLH